MVITVVCDVLGKENNGTTVATMNLIRHLKSKGHKVKIVCCDKERAKDKDVYILEKIDFGILNSFVDKVGVNISKPNRKVLESAIRGSDVVYIMIPLLAGIMSAKIANELSVPIIAGFHMQAENLTAYFGLSRVKFINKLVYKYIYNHLYKYAKAIHYPTKFIRNEFENSIGKLTPGYVISNGVQSIVKQKNVSKPIEYKDKTIILNIGRYSKEKSQEVIIKAISKSKYKNNIILILLGQGQRGNYYKNLANKLNVNTEFKLVDRKELVDIINYSDMYIHSATIELEGISCLEAMCCGKLTIVSDSLKSATRYFIVDKMCIYNGKNNLELSKLIDYWIENKERKIECENKYLRSDYVLYTRECMVKMEEMINEVITKLK